MHPCSCLGVQPIVSVVAFFLMIGGRLAARRTAWYSGRPAVTPPAPVIVESPVTVPSVGAGLPVGPITFGSQS